jgi:Family of unknown function (DUF6286)
VRIVNRVLAALLSLALACLGIVVIVEVIAYRANSHHSALVNWQPFYRWCARTTWLSGTVRGVAIGLIAVGLILLLAELKRPRVTRLAADPDLAGADGIDTAYTRRGVAAAVRTAVTDVDGIRGASVTVKRRRVRVAASAAAENRTAAQELREPVTSAAQARLEELHLRHAAALSVRISPGSR